MPDSQFASLDAAVGAPVADLGPLGQLAEGNEGEERLPADQPGRQRPGELAAVQVGGDVGIEDYRLHGGSSGQVAVAFGVGEGEEVFQLLIRLERVGHQIVERLDWLGMLGGQQLRD